MYAVGQCVLISCVVAPQPFFFLRSGCVGRPRPAVQAMVVSAVDSLLAAAEDAEVEDEVQPNPSEPSLDTSSMLDILRGRLKTDPYMGDGQGGQEAELCSWDQVVKTENSEQEQDKAATHPQSPAMSSDGACSSPLLATPSPRAPPVVLKPQPAKPTAKPTAPEPAMPTPPESTLNWKPNAVPSWYSGKFGEVGVTNEPRPSSSPDVLRNEEANAPRPTCSGDLPVSQQSSEDQSQPKPTSFKDVATSPPGTFLAPVAKPTPPWRQPSIIAPKSVVASAPGLQKPEVNVLHPPAGPPHPSLVRQPMRVPPKLAPATVAPAIVVPPTSGAPVPKRVPAKFDLRPDCESCGKKFQSVFHPELGMTKACFDCICSGRHEDSARKRKAENLQERSASASSSRPSMAWSAQRGSHEVHGNRRANEPVRQREGSLLGPRQGKRGGFAREWYAARSVAEWNGTLEDFLRNNPKPVKPPESADS